MARRRFNPRVTPSPRHRNPNVILPIEGCRCDQCEDARAEMETERIDRVMGGPADEHQESAK